MKTVNRCQRSNWWLRISPIELGSISRLRCIHWRVSCVLARIQLWAILMMGAGRSSDCDPSTGIAVGVLFDGFNSCPQEVTVPPAAIHISYDLLVHVDFPDSLFEPSTFQFIFIPTAFSTPSHFQLFFFLFFFFPIVSFRFHLGISFPSQSLFELYS